MKNFDKTMVLKFSATLFLVILFLAFPAFAKVITQFVPTVSITEEYTDNYFQTKDNKEDEFSTIYGAGLSFGVIDKNASLFLNYNPSYTDQKDQNDDDSWSHAISLIGQGQVSKKTNLTFSERFVRDLSRTSRTNSLEKHDVNITSAGVQYAFGERDALGVNYTYSFDDYENPNLDEYTSHNPSIFLSYWFAPRYGISLNAAYEKTKYDISTDDPETWSGNIRLLRNMNRHLDTYIAYAHTYTDQASGDHSIYNPSAGFDWRPTDDSGITVGFGVLFQEWENPNYDDSQDFFLDLDVYKIFDFSRKGTFSLTGSSGYTPTSEDAASLGFEIYYRAGALFTYRLTRRLTADLNGSYQISRFDEPVVDRQDNTLGLGAGLTWAPLQWLSMDLSYSFEDFSTDSITRDDYQENIVSVSISLTPPKPVRFDGSNPRSTLENQLFD